MGKKSKPPKTPDLGPLIQATQQAAQMAFDNAQADREWAQEQYANDQAVAQPIIQAAMDRMSQNDAWAQEDRAFYEQNFRPLEEQFAQEAANWNSPERAQAEAGRSMATVQQQAEGARQASQRQLESFGVDPSSTRYGALDLGARTAAAAASAAAGNEAYRSSEMNGMALEQAAINVGRGYPGQVAQSNAAAGQAGGQASGTDLATTASQQGALGNPTAWGSLGLGALGQAGTLTNQGYQNELDRYNAKNSTGWGALAGQILGTAAGVGANYALMAKGGAVDPRLSPSGGGAIDDVPARLNVGEYVVPDDAVKWLGEKFFHGIVEKSRKERTALQSAPGGQPAVGGAPAPQQQSAVG